MSYTLEEDRFGNIIVRTTMLVELDNIYFQSEADKDAIEALLTVEERKDLSQGYKIEIAKDEPRSHIFNIYFKLEAEKCPK